MVLCTASRFRAHLLFGFLTVNISAAFEQYCLALQGLQMSILGDFLFFFLILGGGSCLIYWAYLSLRVWLHKAEILEWNPIPSEYGDPYGIKDYLEKQDTQATPRADGQKKDIISESEKRVVVHLASKQKRGDLSWAYDKRYSRREKEITVLYGKEQSLLQLSNNFRLINIGSSKSAKLKKAQKTALSQGLEKAYQELKFGTKQELLPLFFSPNMKNKKSVYLTDENVREVVYLRYKALVEADGLKISDLKKDYLEENEYHYLLPLIIKLN